MAAKFQRDYDSCAGDESPASEHSYGIIPIRLTEAPSTSSIQPSELTTSNTQVLLIYQKTSAPHLPWFWTFPKGHPEASDASPMHTALRELKEETGLLLQGGKGGVLVHGQGSQGAQEGKLIERYMNPVKGWIKEVGYWVGLVESSGAGGGADGEVVVQEAEVASAKWCEWEEALKLVTFDAGKELLRSAMGMLDSGKAEFLHSSML